MTACINTLCDKHICTILGSLSGSYNIANLHKHNRRVLKSLEAGDDLAVRLEIAVRSEQPYRRWAVLGYKRQGRLLKVTHGAVTGDEAGPDPEWAFGRLISPEKCADLVKVSRESVDVFRVWLKIGDTGEKTLLIPSVLQSLHDSRRLVVENIVNLLQDLWSQLIHHSHGFDVLIHLLRATCARDGRADILIAENPGQSQLALLDSQSVRNGLQLLDLLEDTSPGIFAGTFPESIHPLDVFVGQTRAIRNAVAVFT
ncbi:hypothetical protein HG530_006377 [Fusarium avenaceum]|nr:hypothetical protein HG530_006377 [Fusarium avenaceum]